MRGDTDHSGTISFSEFTAWALKEAIISDLEFREKVTYSFLCTKILHLLYQAAQNIRVGEEVLLHGKLKGTVFIDRLHLTTSDAGLVKLQSYRK